MIAHGAPRHLLVVSGPAAWIPPRGHRVGDWELAVERVDGLESALARPAAQRVWDVVAFRPECLHPLPPPRALEALRELAPQATFLPVAHSGDPHEAVFYLKNGAFEYLHEPLSLEDFLVALAEAIDNRDTFQEILDLNRTLETQKEQLLLEKLELERKNRELEAVSQLARALASTLEVGEVLAQLARSIHRTFTLGRVVVGLLDTEGTWEEPRLALGPREETSEACLEGMRWSVRDGERQPWIHTVLLGGRTLRVQDPATHPETRGTPLARVHAKPFVKVPMTAQGRIVGTITVESRDDSPPMDDEDVGILGIFADTAAMAVENARLYQTMRELSVRDELTGLFNRRHLLRQVEAEWNHARRYDMPLSFLMLDIDHFKRLNDGNDHLTGDAALRSLAALLLRNTRGIDTVARYGGEEFAVLLPRTSKKNAAFVADKLRRAVEEAAFEGQDVLPSGNLTVSVGVATFPEDASSVQQLMERADWALYRAKTGGRNRVCPWEESLDRAKAEAG